MRRTGFVSAMTVMGLAVALSALAYPGFENAVVAQYPNATRLNTCGTCHVDFTASSSGLNVYGVAFAGAGGLSDPAGAMTAIQGSDSDGDGATNGEEMTTDTGFLPGFTCETAGTALNAPADILDFVDPANVGCGVGPTTTLPVPTTTITVTTTTVGGGTTTTFGGTTTTTLPDHLRCSQPLSTGLTPIASDCLVILKAAVGSAQCVPECICNPNGQGGITASDAQVCLKKAVGQDIALNCPCGGTTTTTVPGTTTTVPATTTTVPATTTTIPATTTTIGGPDIANGQAIYDAKCALCHSAGSYDPEGLVPVDLAGAGNKLVPDLSTIDPSMQITLTDKELVDLAAFLDSL